jgi:hypothetical protein
MLIVDPTAASGANGRVLEVFGLRNEDAASRSGRIETRGYSPNHFNGFSGF